MAIISNAFDSYKIWYSSGLDKPWRATLQLLNGGSSVGAVFFIKDGAAFPDNSLYDGMIILYLPMDGFAEVMEILRREKPLHVALNDVNLVGWIGTSEEEPVGDEEVLP